MGLISALSAPPGFHELTPIEKDECGETHSTGSDWPAPGTLPDPGLECALSTTLVFAVDAVDRRTAAILADEFIANNNITSDTLMSLDQSLPENSEGDDNLSKVRGAKGRAYVTVGMTRSASPKV
jgi:hypothetical protein